MSRSLKLKPAPPEPDVVTLVRVETCEIRGRTVTRGDNVRVSPNRPYDMRPFWAVFMYAYVDEATGQPVEVTVFGGAGWRPGLAYRSQSASSAYRTVEPHRVTVKDPG